MTRAGRAGTAGRAARAGQASRAWAAGLLVAVMVLAAAVSLDAVFRAPLAGWLVPAAGPALGALAAAALVRSLGPRMVRPLLAGLVVATLAWCRQWWPETLAGGILPQQATGEAVAAWRVELQDTIVTDIIPVAASGTVLAGIGAALALTALVADALAAGLRSPALAGLPPLVLIGAGAALTAGSTPWAALAVAAAAWLGLLTLDPRPATGQSTGPVARLGPRRRAEAAPGRGTVVTAAVALVAVAALALAQAGLPMMGSGIAPEGRRIILGPGSGPVDPASNLGERLRAGNGYAGITYRTEDDRGVYLRAAVVDDVMAVPWDANPPAYVGGPGLVDLAPAATRLDPATGADGDQPAASPVTVRLDRWRGNWAPLPDQALAVEPVDGTWAWQLDRGTATAFRGGTAPVDVTYWAAVRPLEMGLEELADRAGTIAPQGVFNRWGAADAVEGSELQALAEELTADTDNPVEQAAALQGYLLSDRFTYSETAPVDRGYDGTGLEMTEQFLAAGAGYCIHFASAMVMMAQAVDIPARVVVGYAPVAGTGGEHRVTADRAHAWPELYIAGIGWVPFEPTPTVGRTPEYSEPERSDSSDPAPQDDPTVGAAGPSGQASPQPPDGTDPTDDAGPDGTGDVGTPGAPRVPIATVVAVAAVLALLVLAALAPAWLRHRRRRRRLASGSVDLLWTELEDTAVDLGVGRVPHESEQAFAARIGADPALAEAILWTRYAPVGTVPPPGLAAGRPGRTGGPGGAGGAGGAGLAASVRATTEALEASAEPAVRRRARWFPRSLVPESLRR